jgi:hypothetical protein
VEPRAFSLTEVMRDKHAVWEGLVRGPGLAPHSLQALANWAFGDFIFSVESDAFFDVSKARRFGFHEMHLDSVEEAVTRMARLKALESLPA